MGKYQKKTAKAGVWQRNCMIALCAVLGLVLCALIFVTAFVHRTLNLINRVDMGNESTLSSEQMESMWADDLETIDPTDDSTYVNINDITIPTEETYPPVYQGEHVVNILLIGQDRDSGVYYLNRSDTMMLVTFNTSKNTITLTSFMRDAYVNIPGHKPNKLNSAYPAGGMSLLNGTLQANFGVEVDGNVEVDFSGFVRVIDLVGGVEITLTQAEANHLNQLRGWNLSAGTQILNGTEALAYARIRAIDSDYQRTERQRKVIMSLISAVKNKPLTQLIGMLDDILPLVTTNLSNNEILNYATGLFPMLATAQFNSQQIPAHGTFKGDDVEVRPGLKNWFQYDIDFAANREILKRIFATD